MGVRRVVSKFLAIGLAGVLALAVPAAPVLAARASTPGGPEAASTVGAPGPVMLGLTPMYAGAPAPPPAPLSFPLAAGFTYGTPFAVALAGGVLLAPLLSHPQAGLYAVVPLNLLMLAGLGAGYVYAGEPGRGALTVLGQVGVASAATLASALIAVAAFGQGQGAGFGLAIVGVPVIGASLIAYNVWVMRDLHAVIERKNQAAR